MDQKRENGNIEDNYILPDVGSILKSLSLIYSLLSSEYSDRLYAAICFTSICLFARLRLWTKTSGFSICVAIFFKVCRELTPLKIEGLGGVDCVHVLFFCLSFIRKLCLSEY